MTVAVTPSGHRAHSADLASVALSPAFARRLAQRSQLRLDPARLFAIKRNEHEAIVEANAVRFATALEAVLSRAGARFSGVRVARVPGRAGRTFEAGERFQGCLSLELLLPRRFHPMVRRWPRLAAALEEALLSDHAELEEITRDFESGRFCFRYRYLSGTPMAGQSVYEIEPLSAESCRVRVRFEFQELHPVGVAVLHGFGLQAHDRAVAAQIFEAAGEAGGRVVSTTLRT